MAIDPPNPATPWSTAAGTPTSPRQSVTTIRRDIT
jgi:hypothetical protein